jgi:hypothetical protein
MKDLALRCALLLRTWACKKGDVSHLHVPYNLNRFGRNRVSRKINDLRFDFSGVALLARTSDL